MPHICLRDLCVRYGELQILRGITVDIPDAQITAIIGPSGCGKTTLLKSLNRLLDLNEEVRVTGCVLIEGEDIYAPEANVLALRKKVGFLPQRPFPLPMSIYDNIAFGLRIHGVTRDQMQEQIDSLEKSGLLGETARTSVPRSPRTRRGEMDVLVEYYLRLAGLWDEVAERLSGPAARLSVGQQQRLALARALAVEPDVVLADEPTSALDPVSAQLVERQFQLLKHEYTIIVVTHILRQARRIADYVMFMYLGELVEHGNAERVFGAPQDARTRAYVSGEIS